MTPEEHLARADYLLARIDTSDMLFPAEVHIAPLLTAVAHVLVGLAAELGVPHQGPAAGGSVPDAPPAP